MEAQGELLADYFAIKHLGIAPTGQRHSLAMYESVLEHFLLDPGSRANLPRGAGS
jgi:hypothetical protein